MTKERDFSRVTFKVNAAGSWANLVTCSRDHIDKVKEACAVIAEAGGVKFKIVDDLGNTISQYGPRRGNVMCVWHSAR